MDIRQSGFYGFSLCAYLSQCWLFQDDSLIDWLHENAEQVYKVNGPEKPVFIRQTTFDAFLQVY